MNEEEVVIAPLRSTLGDLAEIIGHEDGCGGSMYCTQTVPRCGVWEEAFVALEMIQEIYGDGQK